MNTIVITGANRGLGLALSRVYSERGETVIAGCRNPDAAIELAKLTPHVLAVDTGSETSIDHFVTEIGDRPVDVLINNAGTDSRGLGADPAKRGVLDQTADEFMDQVRINTLGPMLLSRALAPNLRAATNGRIVNVSSQVGSMEIAQHLGSDVGYAASKAALNMVTIKLARALQHDGITAIMLHPGYLRTDMGGSGADLDPDDAARQIVELIAGLTIDDTATFHRWDGSVHPW